MAETVPKQTSEEIVAGLREQLETMRDDALQRIGQREQEAEAQSHRYWTAREELAEQQEHLRKLRAEYESLPHESHEQRMLGEEDAEAKLNERYRDVVAEIPQLEVSIEQLSAELDYLCPGSRRINPEQGVRLEARIPLNAEAQIHSKELEKLQNEVADLLDETLGPVFEKAQGIQQNVSALSSSIEGMFKQERHLSASEMPSHGEPTEPDYAEGDYIAVADLIPLGGVNYLKGDLIRPTGEDETRLVGSGSIVRPDSEVGRLLLTGDTDAAIRKHRADSAYGHTVHRAVHRSASISQQQPEEVETKPEDPEVRPEDDSEALDRMYDEGTSTDPLAGREPRSAEDAER